MKPGLLFLGTAFAGATLLCGLSQFTPVRAQEDPQVRRHVIIRTPDGTKEFDLDPSQLPPPGEGDQVMIQMMGPDGQVMTFAGSPTSLGLLKGPDGRLLAYPGAGMMGGLEIVDPGRSYIHQLIKRDDVRSQLLITAKQREALDGIEKSQQTAMEQQMRQGLQVLGGDKQGKSKEELRDIVQAHLKQVHEQMQSLADERDKRLAAILTPKQMARLKELDLQWRGPLAMGVKPVADQAKLTNEQFPKVVDLLKEYRQEVSRQLSFGLRTAAFTQKPGPGASYSPGAPTPPSTQAEMQVRMEKAKREIEKARKSLGEKALHGLADVQRTQWSSLSGKPFQFRTYN
jgi:hypothetical protein